MSFTKTNNYRRGSALLLAESLHNDCEIAIGSGGHDIDGNAYPADPNQTALNHELMRASGYVEMPNEYTVKVTAQFDLTDLPPGTAISEIGIFNVINEILLAIRNTRPVYVERDENQDYYSAGVIFPF